MHSISFAIKLTLSISGSSSSVESELFYSFFLLQRKLPQTERADVYAEKYVGTIFFMFFHSGMFKQKPFTFQWDLKMVAELNNLLIAILLIIIYPDLENQAMYVKSHCCTFDKNFCLHSLQHLGLPVISKLLIGECL